MKTAEEVRERIGVLQSTKEQLLFPPLFMEARGADPVSAAPLATFESLNAEIAALTWVLGEVDEWRKACETDLEKAIPALEAQAEQAEQVVPK